MQGVGQGPTPRSEAQPSVASVLEADPRAVEARLAVPGQRRRAETWRADQDVLLHGVVLEVVDEDLRLPHLFGAGPGHAQVGGEIRLLAVEVLVEDAEECLVLPRVLHSGRQRAEAPQRNVVLGADVPLELRGPGELVPA